MTLIFLICFERRSTTSALEHMRFLRTMSFWKFANPRLSEAKVQNLIEELKGNWKGLEVHGRIYVGSEGINAQLSVPTRFLIPLHKTIRSNEFLKDIPLNIETKIHYNVPSNSFFPKLKVKFRDQIITHASSCVKENAKLPQISSLNFSDAGEEIDAEEWHNKLSDVDNTLILDCRNEYEQSIGSFISSEPLKVTSYSKSFELLDELEPKIKEKEQILLYCTGGIRCVKIGAYLKQKLKIQNVGMLKGGITAYSKYVTKNKISSKFKGTNFVFDSRIGVPVDEPIGDCLYCKAKTHYQQNCSNPCCNKLIIICDSCKERNNDSCSEECKEYHILDNDKKKHLRQKCTQVFASLPNFDERKDRYPVYKKLLGEMKQKRNFSTIPIRMNSSNSILEFAHHSSQFNIKREKLQLDDYCALYSSSIPDILNEIEEITKKQFPKVFGNICGPDVAQFLSFMVKSRNCSRILELGCFTGYSAITLASSFNNKQTSILDTCDINDEYISIANSFIKKLNENQNINEQCTININKKTGMELLNHIKSTNESYDLIFVDANKSQYREYYSFIIDHEILAENGILIFDNVLFKSLVLPDRDSFDVPKRLLSIGKKIHDFNQFVHSDPRTTQQIIQIRDGLLFVSKIKK